MSYRASARITTTLNRFDDEVCYRCGARSRLSKSTGSAAEKLTRLEGLEARHYVEKLRAEIGGNVLLF
ncbi:unnamed protein product [Linum trigynum]|uniref:Uncharacterized protein n=1 Tax=Linum trigynum TaxID=586398 RepID=A0AAV2G577_9ROSI